MQSTLARSEDIQLPPEGGIHEHHPNVYKNLQIVVSIAIMQHLCIHWLHARQ
jgi:hypothetical protein